MTPNPYVGQIFYTGTSPMSVQDALSSYSKSSGGDILRPNADEVYTLKETYYDELAYEVVIYKYVYESIIRYEVTAQIRGEGDILLNLSSSISTVQELYHATSSIAMSWTALGKHLLDPQVEEEKKKREVAEKLATQQALEKSRIKGLGGKALTQALDPYQWHLEGLKTPTPMTPEEAYRLAKPHPMYRAAEEQLARKRAEEQAKQEARRRFSTPNDYSIFDRFTNLFK